MKNKGNKGKLKKTFYIDYQLYTIFYFLLFIGFCSGSRYLIRIRHLGGFHFWVPFSFYLFAKSLWNLQLHFYQKPTLNN